MAKKNFFSKQNVNFQTLAADITADVSWHIAPVGDGFNVSVPYGSSATVAAYLSATFTPASALSSIQITEVDCIPDDGYFATFGTDGGYPATLINDGTGESQLIQISGIYTNPFNAASNIETEYYWYVDPANALLSAGSDDTIDPAVNNAQYLNTYRGTLTAEAGAPSGVSAFTATPGQTRISLTWTNPRDLDLSAVRIVYAVGNTPPATYADGTILYEGLGTSTEQTGLTGDQIMAYSAWCLDNVGEWSTESDTACATPYTDNIYGWTGDNYLTNAQVRARLFEEGVI